MGHEPASIAGLRYGPPFTNTLDGMSTSRAIGAVAGYAAMALAIAGGVVGFMVADVRLALARIDADDLATWLNMAPQVRYFFIPVVAGTVVVAAVAVNLLLTLIDYRRTVLLSTGRS
jgi:hypothetical protein